MSWLIKRGVTYYIGYRVGTKDRYLSTKKQNEKEAETARLEFDLAQRRQNGEEIAPSPDMTIDSVIELYKKGTDLKDKTVKLNDYSWKKFKLETGLVRIGEATTENISDFRDDMLEDYANASVSIWLRDIKKLFKFAKESGIIMKDPATAVELPDEDVVFRFFTPDEESAILTHASPILNRVVTVGFETGLRITQLVEMDWKHYRPAEKIYYVEKQKRQKARYIPISPRALESMGSIRLSGRVFPDSTNRSQISHMWTRAKENAGIIGRARFHDIRHTYVSRICKVLDPIEVRDLMGWCSVEMVDRYTHSRVSDIQAKLNQGTSVLSLVSSTAPSVVV